jgi:hypothetical protein
MKLLNHSSSLSLLKLLYLFPLFIISGCKKFVEVNAPTTSLTGINVYASNSTATAVLTGIYSKWSSGIIASGINGISLECGLSADELKGTASSLGSTLSLVYKNALTNQSTLFWANFYNYLYTINAALEGVTNSISLYDFKRKWTFC